MRNLLCTSALVLLGMPGIAAAQTAAASTAEAGDNNSAQLQDIVVTAQRRAENVQKSNLSIAVLGRDELRRSGVADPKDLNNLVAGVTIAQRGSNTQVYIRGIGDNSATGLSVPAVAVNVDGVYIDRPTAVSPNFYDLERVEVLKGPQGTLYGRNASGGALNLITNKPTQTAGGYIDLEAGNFSLLKAVGALNVPVGETMAARFAFQVVSRDGYLSNGYNDQKSQAGRLQFLWTPDALTSLRVSGDVAHIGGKGAGTVFLPRIAGTDPWQGASEAAPAAALRAGSIALLGPTLGALAYPPRDDGYMRNNTANISAEFNRNLGFATFTLIPAYRHMKLDYVTYEPGYYYHNNERASQSTIEARLANQQGPFKWTVGAFGFNEKQHIDQYNLANFGVFENYVPIPIVDTKSYAFFGEASVSVAPQLRLIGGLRYTHEKKNISGTTINTFGLPVGTAPTPRPVGVPFVNSLTNSATNYKAGVEFDVAPRSMLYATIATGFKAGGFFPGPLPNAYKPEKLRAIQLGSRNRFLDNRLQVNLEGFYWKYTDLQQSRQGFASNGTLTFLTINAGTATLYGGDIDIQLKASRADTIGATLEYNHARYDSFAFDTGTGRAITGVTTGCPVGPAHLSDRGLSIQTIDCSGFQLQRTPRWTATANYQHVFDIGDRGHLTFNASAAYMSSRYLSIDFIGFLRTGDDLTEDASLTYAPRSGGWELTAWVKNISNRAVYTAGVQYGFARNIGFGNINPPRTYGARLHFPF